MSKKIIEINELNPNRLEKENVLKVYDDIASHFSHTRHTPWPNIKNFVDSLPHGSFLLDIGCGNGKYIVENLRLIQIGCDTSLNLLDICAQRSIEVCATNCLNLPFQDETFDATICIAVIHHLATEERRFQAVLEMCRILRRGGRGLVYVWALEQKRKGVKSAYLKNKKDPSNQSEILQSDNNMSKLMEDFSFNCRNEKKLAGQNRVISDCGRDTGQFEENMDTRELNNSVNLTVHKNKTEFVNQDVLVPWTKQNKAKKENKKINVTRKIKSTDIKIKNIPKSTCTDSILTAENFENKDTIDKNKIVFHRFYHVFKEGELESMFLKINFIQIISSYYDEGNWCILFEKTC